MTTPQHLIDAARAVEHNNLDGAGRHLDLAVHTLTPQSLYRHGHTDDEAAQHAKAGMYSVARHDLLIKDLADAHAHNAQASNLSNITRMRHQASGPQSEPQATPAPVGGQAGPAKLNAPPTTLVGTDKAVAGAPKGQQVPARQYANISEQLLDMSAETARLAVTPAPRGKPGGPGLYDVKGMGHSAYFQQVVKALIEKRGMPPGKAYKVAWGAMRKWTAGGGKAHPEVRAAAGAALAEEKAKGVVARASHGHANSVGRGASSYSTPSIDAVELAFNLLERRDKHGEWTKDSADDLEKHFSPNTSEGGMFRSDMYVHGGYNNRQLDQQDAGLAPTSEESYHLDEAVKSLRSGNISQARSHLVNSRNLIDERMKNNNWGHLYSGRGYDKRASNFIQRHIDQIDEYLKSHADPEKIKQLEAADAAWRKANPDQADDIEAQLRAITHSNISAALEMNGTAWESQQRTPKGQPGGGQFTKGGSSSGGQQSAQNKKGGSQHHKKGGNQAPGHGSPQARAERKAQLLAQAKNDRARASALAVQLFSLLAILHGHQAKSSQRSAKSGSTTPKKTGAGATSSKQAATGKAKSTTSPKKTATSTGTASLPQVQAKVLVLRAQIKTLLAQARADTLAAGKL